MFCRELSSLRNSKSGANFCDVFNEVLAVRCCRGKYPHWMLDLWHAFDEENGELAMENPKHFSHTGAENAL